MTHSNYKTLVTSLHKVVKPAEKTLIGSHRRGHSSVSLSFPLFIPSSICHSSFSFNSLRFAQSAICVVSLFRSENTASFTLIHLIALIIEMGEEAKKIVPESVLKKRKREEEWALAKKTEIEAAKKKRAESRKLIYNRAKQYAKEYDEKVHVANFVNLVNLILFLL